MEGREEEYRNVVIELSLQLIVAAMQQIEV